MDISSISDYALDGTVAADSLTLYEYLSEIRNISDGVLQAAHYINALAAFIAALLIVIIFAIVWGRR